MDNTKAEVIHGTALKIFGYGVVIIGNSGNGKSELALKLIDRKHKLIADDHVIIKRNIDNSLWVYPAHTQFIHLSGIGFVDIATTYGNQAIITKPTKCNLFIELNNNAPDHPKSLEKPSLYTSILDQKVPLAKLFVAQNRPLDLLVEVLVKTQQQIDNNYDANQIFIDSLNLAQSKKPNKKHN